MKKLAIIISLLIISFLSFSTTVAKADESQDEEVTIESEVSNLIENIDLSELEEYVDELPNEIIGNTSLKEQLFKMLKGEVNTSFNSVSNYVVSVFFSGIKQKLPTFITIFSLLLICAIINAIKPQRLGGGVYEISFFACYTIIVTIIITVAYTFCLLFDSLNLNRCNQDR